MGLYCQERARDHGLILRSIGDSVAFCPPLIITPSEIDEMIGIFAKALNETEKWVEDKNFREMEC